MKKVFVSILVIALAVVVAAPAQALTNAELLTALQALSPAQLTQLLSSAQGSALGSPEEFTMNLKLGSRGNDVERLQMFLEDSGLLDTNGHYGYFGPLTKAGVIKYQKANGLPSTGYFGPMTREVVNAELGSAPGPVVTLPAGCTVGAVYNSVTGALCSTPNPTPAVSNPSEGSITTKLAGEPANDANVRRTTDVKVWGVEVSAIGSDMRVDRLDLQFAVTVGGSAQNPGSFVTGISILDGSTKLVEKALTSADFYKDTSNRYHVIVSGIGFNVPKGTTKTVTVAINTVSISSSDTARVLTVQGYAGSSQNVRAQDTVGLQSYTDMSGSSNTRTHTFNSPGSSTLTTSLNAAGTPKSTNSRVSTTDGVQKMLMQQFDVKSTTGVSKVTDIGVAVNASNTVALPSTLFLYDGDTLLGSVTAGTSDGAAATFTSLSLLVPQDTTKTLTVKATFPTSVTNGLSASTSIQSAGNILYDKPDGSSGNGGPTSEIASNDQYFYSAVSKWTLVSASNIGAAGVVNVSSSSVSGAIVLKVKADGGSITKPVVGDFSIWFASSTVSGGAYTAANAIQASNTSVTVLPTDSSLGDGGEYTVTINGNLFSNNVSYGASSGTGYSEAMVLASVKSNLTGTQTWGIDDFNTPKVLLSKGTF